MVGRLLLFALFVMPAVASAAERQLILRLGAESDSNPTRTFGAEESVVAGPKGTISFVDERLAWPDGLLTTEAQVGARWLPLREDWAAVWRLGGGLNWSHGGAWSHRAHGEFRGRSEAPGDDGLGMTRDYERVAATLGSARSWERLTLESAAGYAAFGYAADSGRSWHGPTASLSLSYAASEAVTLSASYEPSLRMSAETPFLLTESLTQSTGARLQYDAGRWVGSVSGSATAASAGSDASGGGDYLHETLEITLGGLLWGDAVGRLSGVLQRVAYDGAGSVVELAVEDEDRNQVSIAIEQPLGDGWGLEGRYQRYLQRLGAATSSQNDFERHIAFVGLSWRSEREGAEP
jgi:hypothetical protein